MCKQIQYQNRLSETELPVHVRILLNEKIK